MEDNELDLTAMNMANRHHLDVYKIRNKSIKTSNSKAKRIFGEIYRGKYVTREQIKKFVFIATTLLVSLKGLKGVEVNDYYNASLKNQAKQEMSFSDSLDYLDEYDTSLLDKYDNYKESLSEIESDNYDLFGNRKDGTHNERIKNSGGIISLSDKEKDAIDMAVANEIEEYKRGK